MLDVLIEKKVRNRYSYFDVFLIEKRPETMPNGSAITDQSIVLMVWTHSLYNRHQMYQSWRDLNPNERSELVANVTTLGIDIAKKMFFSCMSSTSAESLS